MRSLTDGLEEKAPAKGGGGGEGGGLRDTLNDLASGVGGKVFLGLLAVGMLAFLVTRLQGALGPAPETMAPGQVRIMDPLTGEMRWYTLEIGGKMPEGFYSVEYCWANHDGDGVPVIMNRSLFPAGDPRRDEPTTCPCCPAPVVGHNPKPDEYIGMTPSDYDTRTAPDCVVEHYTQLLGG